MEGGQCFISRIAIATAQTTTKYSAESYFLSDRQQSAATQVGSRIGERRSRARLQRDHSEARRQRRRRHSVRWYNFSPQLQFSFSPQLIFYPNFPIEDGIIRKIRVSKLHYQFQRYVTLTKTVQLELQCLQFGCKIMTAFIKFRTEKIKRDCQRLNQLAWRISWPKNVSSEFQEQVNISCNIFIRSVISVSSPCHALPHCLGFGSLSVAARCIGPDQVLSRSETHDAVHGSFINLMKLPNIETLISLVQASNHFMF